jgi:hypothetical protein
LSLGKVGNFVFCKPTKDLRRNKMSDTKRNDLFYGTEEVQGEEDIPANCSSYLEIDYANEAGEPGSPTQFMSNSAYQDDTSAHAIDLTGGFGSEVYSTHHEVEATPTT